MKLFLGVLKFRLQSIVGTYDNCLQELDGRKETGNSDSLTCANLLFNISFLLVSFSIILELVSLTIASFLVSTFPLNVVLAQLKLDVRIEDLQIKMNPSFLQ